LWHFTAIFANSRDFYVLSRAISNGNDDGNEIIWTIDDVAFNFTVIFSYFGAFNVLILRNFWVLKCCGGL
jgi:hypothetical protein